jgi:hypothetical protein
MQTCTRHKATCARPVQHMPQLTSMHAMTRSLSSQASPPNSLPPTLLLLLSTWLSLYPEGSTCPYPLHPPLQVRVRKSVGSNPTLVNPEHARSKTGTKEPDTFAFLLLLPLPCFFWRGPTTPPYSPMHL